MSFQLLNIAVYNAEGERREITFEPGEVNIVTGGSRTGKTALIYIVDYCLGRRICAVPSGVIRDTVAWYAVRIQTADAQMVIGRPSPPPGQASVVDVYLEVAAALELPDFSDLKKNSTVNALRAHLTETVGITPNQNVPPEGHSRRPLTANFGHTCFYMFQPQDYIAKRNILFYRQDEEQLAHTIRDTLPYFLGAVGDDRYEKVQRLRRLRRQGRMLERRISEEEALRGHDNSRAVALFSEAVNVGLASGDAPDEFEGLIETLRGLLDWEPQTPSLEGEDTLAELQDQREQLRADVKTTDGEIEAAKAFALRQQGFSDEVVEQKHRLRSIGLYQENGESVHTCPLCNNEIEDALPTVPNLLESIANIDQHISSVARQRPRLDAYISEREDRLAELTQAAEENRAAIEAVYAQQEVLQEHRSRQAAQARTVGRVSLFLDSLEDVSVDGEQLTEQLSELNGEMESLEDELADEAAEDQLDATLRIIGGQMSRWAEALELEFSDCPLEFDLTNLTVVAFRESGRVRLLDMGSAENWMGYHLVTHFALHKWFVEKSRPVPRFLMLDQPTQVYFPGDPPEDGSIEELEDEDRHKVQELFKFIFEVVRSLHPHFQVIITDHANLREQWYQDAVVQRWWGDEKFIPAEWYE